MKPLTVAVVQAASVLFDREKTIEKTMDLMAQVKQTKSLLALFPEAFIPAYPRGFSFGMKVGSRSEAGRSLYERYWNNAVEVPGPEVRQLGKAAKDHHLYLSIVNEKKQHSVRFERDDE